MRIWNAIASGNRLYSKKRGNLKEERKSVVEGRFHHWERHIFSSFPSSRTVWAWAWANTRWKKGEIWQLLAISLCQSFQNVSRNRNNAFPNIFQSAILPTYAPQPFLCGYFCFRRKCYTDQGKIVVISHGNWYYTFSPEDWKSFEFNWKLTLIDNFNFPPFQYSVAICVYIIKISPQHFQVNNVLGKLKAKNKTLGN